MLLAIALSLCTSVLAYEGYPDSQNAPGACLSLHSTHQSSGAQQQCFEGLGFVQARLFEMQAPHSTHTHPSSCANRRQACITHIILGHCPAMSVAACVRAVRNNAHDELASVRHDQLL